VTVALHWLWFFDADRQQSRESTPATPPEWVVVATATDPPVAREPLPEADSVFPVVEEQVPERFRPNIEPETHEEAPSPGRTEPQESPPQEDSVSDLDEKIVESTMVEPSASPSDRMDPSELRAEMQEYRRDLTGRFMDEFTQVPELRTVIKDLRALPAIDRHFGIVVLAYCYVDHKPGPPFILLTEDPPQKLDHFDFSSYSNRVKDRMLYSHYRSTLQMASDQFQINTLTKAVGLIPLKSDQYFSSKQMRAIELANLDMDQVQATEGHYAPDGLGGYCLIIDSVVTRDGRTLAIQDDELRFLPNNS